MNELKDQVAIVTGGGYGIGREIALAYGRAGAKVVVAARTEKPLKETVDALNQLGATSTFVRTDVSKEADCAGMAELTLKAFGRIDILVNNAGIAGPTKRIPDMSLAEWQETIDINLTGAWLAARAVLPTMDKQRSGEHFLGSGTPRLPDALAVRRLQVGDARAYPDHRRGMGRARNPLQLHLSGANRGRSYRTGHARARSGDEGPLRANS